MGEERRFDLGQRRVLVIGSQCDALGHLSFLPQVAEELYSVLIDPTRGNCRPALDGTGLVLDPGVTDTAKVLRTGFQRAAADQATLVLAYIGHAIADADGQFWLLVRDASMPLMWDTAVHFTYLLGQLLDTVEIDGLVVLIDACQAGVGATEALQRWFGTRRPARVRRFEVLTAAADRPAADGCFSRTLVDLLQAGLPTVPSEFVRCEQARLVLEDRCPNQEPQHPTYNADPGLYLARNGAWAIQPAPWVATTAASEVVRLTEWLQPTLVLDEVVTATQTTRCLTIRGLAGTGKSTLAAALARPEASQDRVPADFVQAIVFLSEAMTSADVADQLTAQLSKSVPGFVAAQADFQRDLTREERDRLDALQRNVLGALRRLPGGPPVRIVFDGLEQLATPAQAGLSAALDALATEPALARIRLVVTSRPDTDMPTCTVRDVHEAGEHEVQQYLVRRAIPVDLRAGIVDRAKGNWLVASLLADLVAHDPIVDPDRLPSTLADVYNRALRSAGAGTSRWRTELRPVLAVLGAAGSGPVLPLQLLCAASGKLGGPDRPSRIRDVLVDLRGLVAREAPGTDSEHVGVFHATLAAYLFGHGPRGAFAVDEDEPHRALAEAIVELAPAPTHDRQDPLHQYAAAREAEHLWAIGAYDRAIASLAARETSVVTENLQRWRGWHSRVRTTLGPDHPDTLLTRGTVAHWTGQSGDTTEALLLFRELLEDQVRVLGPDHPHTLATRSNIAHFTGLSGDIFEAVGLFEDVLPDQVRVLGPDHPDTLATRSNIARWTAEYGDIAEALRVLEELLADQRRVLGPDHRATLFTRGSIALRTGMTGKNPEALRLFEELLADQVRVLGADHRHTLATRRQIAECRGESGEATEALRLLEALLVDQQRLLGPDHPDTLATRSLIGYWTAETGAITEALRLYRELLPDQVRALGPHHPDTLGTRGNIVKLAQR